MKRKTLIFLHLRPSSHSEDHTVLAVFLTDADASTARKKMKKKLRSTEEFRDVEQAYIESNGKLLMVHGYFHEETPTKINRFLKEQVGLEQLAVLQKQFTKVTATFPGEFKGNLEESFAIISLLFSGEQVQCIKRLIEATKPKIRVNNGKTTMIFTHIGNDVWLTWQNSEYSVSGVAISLLWKNLKITHVPNKILKALKPEIIYPKPVETKLVNT